MSDAGEEPSDGLRDVDQLLRPDSRMSAFAVQFEGGARAMTPSDRHAAIAWMSLCPEVPEAIRTHFDTALNLYQYAWFVYRFHAVAEQQALTTLEFALKRALEREGLMLSDGASEDAVSPNATERKRKFKKQEGLSGLLKLAAEHSLIANERLPLRMEWARELARRRASVARIQTMSRSGLDVMIVPNEHSEPTEQELHFDWIGSFRSKLPRIRNTYAHGSDMIHSSILRTFEVVWSLVNQLFDNQGQRGVVKPVRAGEAPTP